MDFVSWSRAARLWVVAAIAALACASSARAAPPKVDVVSFGLWGDQSVFASEAEGAARIVARQYGHGGKVVVRVNTEKRGDATEDNLRATLASLGATMDPERDVLFLILTSHGDQRGIDVATPSDKSFITPIELRDMLRESGARLSVVVVSACYSGIFADALAEPDTLVITAADADHASFGCRDGAKWTTFGEAFFGDAVAQTKTLPEAFALARSRIAAREQAEGFDPSNPQMAGGAHVLDRLQGKEQ
ncbi:MAG: C13 family peptidase [Roseiarcus sp.]